MGQRAGKSRERRRNVEMMCKTNQEHQAFNVELANGYALKARRQQPQKGQPKKVLVEIE